MITGPVGLRVLFIGNSYTFYNAMPEQVGHIARELGTRCTCEYVVEGGATLRSHFEQGEATRRLQNGNFTHVVLQEKSTGSLHSRNDFDDYVDRFVEHARQSGTEPLLYLTWARAEGSEVYTADWSGGSPQLMLNRLQEAYETAAHRNSARIIPIGSVWMYAITQGAPASLHDVDLHHASPLGGHVTALTFARLLTQRSVAGVEFHPKDVSPDAATFARRVVENFAALES